MPNEEIVSALRNAIDHGETLQSAVQLMINSGYNLEEVQEASRFIGSGTLSMQEIKPEEQLTMPEEKSSKFKFWAKNEPENKIIQQPKQQFQPQFQQKPIQSIQKPVQPPVQQLPQYSQQVTQEQIKQSFQQPFKQYPQIPRPAQQYPPQQYPQVMQAPRPTPQLIPRPGELSREIQKIQPAKQSYLKEIILLIILLILIGILAATIFFKDKILGWFA